MEVVKMGACKKHDRVFENIKPKLMLRAEALCSMLQSSVTIHAIFSGQKTSHSKTCDRMGAPYGMEEEQSQGDKSFYATVLLAAVLIHIELARETDTG